MLAPFVFNFCSDGVWSLFACCICAVYMCIMAKFLKVKGYIVADRPKFPKRAIVTAGMPYGNKGLHFGHVGGVFVPADIYARFLRDRIGAENVIFVSGTDCYGSPIMEGYRKLKEAGEFDGTILDYVKKNHDSQFATMQAFGISLDRYEGSGLGLSGEVHEKVTQDVITKLYENGWLEKRSTPQFYDVEAQTFLNGRQVQGYCPVQGCKSEKAYADECDLGHQFMPQDLIKPISQLTGTVPEMRDVTNWYFKLPLFRELIAQHMDTLENDERVRPVTTQTIREFLVPPIVYVKNELEEDYRAIASELPQHTFLPAEKGKQSFGLQFADFEECGKAQSVLASHGIRYRAGKLLVPFRLTGNIDWGIPAPELEGLEDLTVWCWPESLWAPISFSSAELISRGEGEEAWRDWWCSDDAGVYQFIGQDNIYFYGVAQTALWSALQDKAEPTAEGSGTDLRQTTLIPNHHILFLGTKASSSGKVKPPLAEELLDHYTVEQLRVHWAALGLDQKSVSFSPKIFNPNADENAPDPVLKEGALLTNIFNRLARSCFYTAQKYFDGKAPLGDVSEDVLNMCEDAILKYENLMYHFELHSVMACVDEFIRDANRYWTRLSREASEAQDQTEAFRQLLIDAFHLLRVSCVLMHPIVPDGTELIYEYFDITQKDKCADCETPCVDPVGFFSWKNIFKPLEHWALKDEKESGMFNLKELPARFDFFKKHESQYK